MHAHEAPECSARDCATAEPCVLLHQALDYYERAWERKPSKKVESGREGRGDDWRAVESGGDAAHTLLHLLTVETATRSQAAYKASLACDKLSRGADSAAWRTRALELPGAGAADAEIDRLAAAAAR